MKGLLILLLWCGCAGPRAGGMGWLPEIGQAGPVEHFPRGQLWVNLNGAASLYEDYGCQQLWVRSYTVDGIRLSARVFELDLPLHAFGLFSQLRSPGSRPLALGEEGALGQSELLFWQGRYFVSLVLRDPGASAPELLEGLGRRVSRQLPPGQGRPAILGLLPDSAKVADSEQYLRDNALGYAALYHGVSAAYQLGSGTARLYVFALDSEAAAMAGLEEVAAGLEERRGLALGSGGAEGRDPYEGDTALFAQGTHLVLLRGAGATQHGLLERCAALLAGRE